MTTDALHKMLLVPRRVGVERGIDIPGRDNKRCALNLIRVCVPIASRMSCDKQQQQQLAAR